MDLACFKRFRMEINLLGRDLTPPPMPDRYEFLPWNESLLDAFAQAKFLSFRQELDTNVFPCLAEFDGCKRLMREIVGKPGFLPKATWLIRSQCDKRDSPIFVDTKIGTVPSEGRPARPDYCGTVQGVRDPSGIGAIQNIGIARHHRRRGLGRQLLLRSLDGFRRSGVNRVYLEVTAQNHGAIQLYRQVGFSTVKIVYKTVETAYSQ
jgi:ribosomal protein S18 acetylase RimI-like enzyme